MMTLILVKFHKKIAAKTRKVETMKDMMPMITETGTTGTLIMKTLTEETISKFQKTLRTIATTKIMMSTVIIEAEEVAAAVARKNSGEARVLVRSLIGGERVNPKKMDLKILTLDPALLITGTGGGVAEEVVGGIIPGETPECLPQAGLKGVKTPETVLHKAAEGIQDAIPQPVLITAGQIPL